MKLFLLIIGSIAVLWMVVLSIFVVTGTVTGGNISQGLQIPLALVLGVFGYSLIRYREIISSWIFKQSLSSAISRRKMMGYTDRQIQEDVNSFQSTTRQRSRIKVSIFGIFFSIVSIFWFVSLVIGLVND
jgi:hypothetical protein